MAKARQNGISFSSATSRGGGASAEEPAPSSAAPPRRSSLMEEPLCSITIDARGQDDSDDEFIDASPSPSSGRSSSPAAALANKSDAHKKNDPDHSTVARPLASAGPTCVSAARDLVLPTNNSSGRFPTHHHPRSDCYDLEAKEDVRPKKRRRGIPRVLQSSPEALGSIGFQELVKHGGGQSQPISAVTGSSLPKNTTIPESLQCALCQGLVHNAVTLPWDTVEGRTACEQCIGDALRQTNFLYCPLTQQTGRFSPKDLVPHRELRVLVEQFVKDNYDDDNNNNKQKQWKNVISKVVEGQTMTTLPETNALTHGEPSGMVRHTAAAAASSAQSQNEPLGCGSNGDGDDFGGDIFASSE